MSRRLYSKPEAAEQMSISVRVLETLIHDGDLETITIGRRRLVPADCIDEYIERQRKAS